MEREASESASKRDRILSFVNSASSVGALFFLDQGLASCFADFGWTFPSPLVGMFIILGVMWAVSGIFGNDAAPLTSFFQPGTDWIQKWVPLFYLPPLVVLPGRLTSFSRADITSVILVVGIGWATNLWLTARVTLWIRKITLREIKAQAPTAVAPPKSPQGSIIFWLATALVCFFLFLLFESSLVGWVKCACLLASTVCGLLLGHTIHEKTGGFIHPILTSAAVAYLAAGTTGLVEGLTWNNGVQAYLPKGEGKVGPGTVLVSILGSVILSFGCRVFHERATMVRHRWEIGAGIVFCSLFTMFSTVLMGRILRMRPELIVALMPRSVTVALALPMAGALGSQLPSVTAGAVVLTGLLGANFSQKFLNVMGVDDPITRGVSAASSAHGLATAALGSSEPDALPFCSLAYALSGVVGTLFVHIPLINNLLLELAG